MKSLLILGRQPEIGIAELESLYTPTKVTPINQQVVLVDVDPCLLAFDRLGGAIKFAKVLTTLPTSSWTNAEKFLLKVAPDFAKTMPVGKMHLGISDYGFSLTPRDISKTALKLKSAIVKTNRSVRVVPNNELSLSSAQVIHHKLTTPNGWELLIIKDTEKTIIAQTIKVQDIQAYADRDQRRPARDARVGMLPPKLAQIIINLACGTLPEESIQSVCDIPPDQPIPKQYFKGQLLLDPFCGSGVILQESAIMGYDCVGTDIDPRMVDYARTNLDWLSSVPNSPISQGSSINISVGDATNHQWTLQPTIIAGETYLGKPYSAFPTTEQLNGEIRQCNQIVVNFLNNLYPQISPKTRICLAIPAWRQNNGLFTRLPLLDQLEDIGYNRVSFVHLRDRALIYFRENQIVARELLVLIRK